MSRHYDLVIIGAGPGGYVAAIRAGQCGIKTAIVEKEHLGGVCLNWGCIPTKSLLHSADLLNTIKSDAACNGINVDNVSFSLHQMVQNAKASIKKLSQGISFLLAKNKVDVVTGYGKLCGNNKVQVNSAQGKEIINAKNIILATGARPKKILNCDFDGQIIWSYKDAIFNTIVPQKLCIVGAGAIGIEFASIYNSLGCDVTVIEQSARVLSNEDKEISELMRLSLEKKGIKVLLNARIKTIQANTKHSNASVFLIGIDEKPIELEFSNVLIAAGITPNTNELGLDTTSIQCSANGLLKVNDKYQTCQSNIYAIGDLIEGPWLAHKASIEGLRCIDIIQGKQVLPLPSHMIPSCTYSFPEVASIGLCQDSATAQGYKIKVGRSDVNSNGKALISQDKQVFIKTIFDVKTGELLGAHMIGKNVSELIHSYSTIIRSELNEIDIFNTVYPHPTKSELLQESALNAYSIGIHS